MASLITEKEKYDKQEEKLFIELDKGIDDMEQGNIMPHEEAMKLIREKINSYAI